MSMLKEYTLSIIREATETSGSDEQTFRHPAVSLEYSQYAENYAGAQILPRGSISETSYGEPIPAGQSAFRSLGLGVSLPNMYEKSLPSLPRGSVALTASARSEPKTVSAKGSVAKSGSSKHSVVMSQRSIGLEMEPEVSRSAAEHPGTSHVAHTESQSAGGSVVSERLISRPSSPPPKSVDLSSASSVASSHTSSQPSSASPQTTLRTFDDVVEEVATSLALRTKMRAETVASSDHTKIGVCATMSRTDNDRFMRILAAKIHQVMTLHHSYLFALIPTIIGGPLETPATLVFCGSPQHLVTRASILAGLRFKTRLAELQDTAGTWVGLLESDPAESKDLDPHAHDEDVLWDIVRKAANPVDPAEPPPGSQGVEQLLTAARTKLDRLSPRDAYKEAVEDGILVDIRSEAQRTEHGSIPGAMIIDRNVLEWRFDPRYLDGRLPIADRYDLRIILYSQEGYSSSLAAAALQNIGLWRATDVDGGFMEWKREGLPTLDHSVDTP